MQKVKDRKAKLERRRDDRNAREERQRDGETARGSTTLSSAGADDSYGDGPARPTDTIGLGGGGDGTESTKVFEDDGTRDQFGGTVVVTTTFGVPSDDESDCDDDEEMIRRRRARKGNNSGAVGEGNDDQQRYAGSVTRFMTELKGNMPSAKRAKSSSGGFAGTKRGGVHGAAGMKGMGSGTDVKMARKMLGRAETGGGGRSEQGSGSGREEEGCQTEGTMRSMKNF